MSLQKTHTLLMPIIKIIAIGCCLLSIPSIGYVLYDSEEEATHEYFIRPLNEVEAAAKKGDNRAIYLLSQHQFEMDNERDLAINTMKSLAQKNISDAKYSLYLLSNNKESKQISSKDGLHYLTEAAEDGYAPAQEELATLYYSGNGVEYDLEKYHYWMKKAANAGNGEAMLALARSYFAGRGITKDDTKGFEWVLKALENQKGLFHNWDLLAMLYEQGRGTPVDLVKAYMCYDLEGTAGIDEKARIAPRMTERERAEGLRLSREWQAQNHSYTFPALGLEHQSDGSYRQR